MNTPHTIEVFSWERVRYIYQSNVDNDPEMRVFEWLLDECGCKNSSRAIDISTSPKLKNY